MAFQHCINKPWKPEINEKYWTMESAVWVKSGAVWISYPGQNFYVGLQRSPIKKSRFTNSHTLLYVCLCVYFTCSVIFTAESYSFFYEKSFLFCTVFTDYPNHSVWGRGLLSIKALKTQISRLKMCTLMRELLETAAWDGKAHCVDSAIFFSCFHPHVSSHRLTLLQPWFSILLSAGCAPQGNETLMAPVS